MFLQGGWGVRAYGLGFGGVGEGFLSLGCSLRLGIRVLSLGLQVKVFLGGRQGMCARNRAATTSVQAPIDSGCKRAAFEIDCCLPSSLPTLAQASRKDMLSENLSEAEGAKRPHQRRSGGGGQGKGGEGSFSTFSFSCAL